MEMLSGEHSFERLGSDPGESKFFRLIEVRRSIDSWEVFWRWEQKLLFDNRIGFPGGPNGLLEASCITGFFAKKEQ